MFGEGGRFNLIPSQPHDQVNLTNTHENKDDDACSLCHILPKVFNYAKFIAISVPTSIIRVFERYMTKGYVKSSLMEDITPMSPLLSKEMQIF